MLKNRSRLIEATMEELLLYLPKVCAIAFDAGRLISQRYHQDMPVEVVTKPDGTPVTEADKAADVFICEALRSLTPHIPLVTEESVANVPSETRQSWSSYWLVDPLDGTKEFIERTGEFSVNIALVINHKSVLGVVYGPELGNLYFSVVGSPAYKLPSLVKVQNAQNWSKLLKMASVIRVSSLASRGQSSLTTSADKQVIRVAVSRRHGGMTQDYISQLGDTELILMGSALKTCLVAEGGADVYPRFGLTSLWDTAASQCILESAGGALLNATGDPLQYIQTVSLLNPFFVAVSDKSFAWPSFPEAM